MSQELEHIWSRVQAQLALVVDESTYRSWLEPLHALEIEQEHLLVEAPVHACRWIRQRFGRTIQASVELVVGPGASVEIIAAPAHSVASDTQRAPDTQRARPRQARRRGSAEAGTADAAVAPATSPGPLGNPKLTFDQFVIGDCNRLAHAAALTVAEMPAQAYNPLFICGPPGVGKTHLLSSIAILISAHNPGLTVRCTTGEAFTNAFLGALSGGDTETFKLHFRDVDVLLLDDVQFLERKTKTEEEFFHTFNALHDGGRQIVLSSDRPPQDLNALEDRLRERFEAGLVADIKPPDLTTRLAILRKRVQHDKITLADTEVLGVLASRICSSVRALEGALIRVVAFSSLTGRPLTAELAGEVLDSLYPRAAGRAHAPRTIDEIQAAACAHFGVSPDELVSPARAARIAWPRQLAMYLSRELTDASLPTIGRQFGGRDHTTVLHACRRASARIASDDACREAVEKLRTTLEQTAETGARHTADRPS